MAFSSQSNKDAADMLHEQFFIKLDCFKVEAKQN